MENKTQANADNGSVLAVDSATTILQKALIKSFAESQGIAINNFTTDDFNRFLEEFRKEQSSPVRKFGRKPWSLYSIWNGVFNTPRPPPKTTNQALKELKEYLRLNVA